MRRAAAAAGKGKEGDALIRTTVRFVLLLKDDFSGAPTPPGGHAFRVDGRPVQPVRKDGGYFVFTGPPGGTAQVEICSAAYQPCTVRVYCAELPRLSPVQTVRLCRRPGLSFSDCGWLRGTARPNTMAVGLIGWEPPLLLREFCGEGRAGFRPVGYFAPNVSGQCLCLGEGKARELLAAGTRSADGSYTLDAPPKKKHAAGETFLRACRAPCGADGTYCMAVPPDTPPRQVRVLCYDEEAGTWESLCVPAPS